ncbi:MAG TPA: aminotransferase class V-fold PLP-dependent enzyme [Gemmatimonadaceae bacterium]|nr:aminotransferase class V-fold PLP-dependent enzyme [Gemmatimonadaceae bacterium]
MTDPTTARHTRRQSLEELRATEFPWTLRGDVVYLNHASTGPLPWRAVRALNHFDRLRSEPWRISVDYQFGVLARARELLAQCIGAGPDEIALMVNTTYGINVAAWTLPLRAGDVVVAPDREFPANVYPWLALEREKGVVYRRIPCRAGLADEEALLSALDWPGVRVLSVSWVSFETGYRLDLERLGAACRERGIWFVVDAIQGLGAAPLDVRRCNVDFLACGGQKWLLAPWGTGFVYVRRELIDHLTPVPVGWMAVRAALDFAKLCDYDLSYHPDARRFEVITLPFQEFAGLNAALEMFAEVGWDRVHDLIAERSGQVLDFVQRRRDLQLITPVDPDRRAGIVSFRPRDPEATSRRLAEAGVVHSVREGAIRIAPHFYTTEGEIDRLLTVLAVS